MVNRILYSLVTLPVLAKAGCAGIITAFLACSCLFILSIPGANARLQASATATAVAKLDQATQVAIQGTSTSVAYVTATAEANQRATATSLAVAQQATRTAVAAPTVTAQALIDATTTALAGATATSQAHADATVTANALATAYTNQTAEAIAAADRATATAEAYTQATATAAQQATAAAQVAAEATATIESYRKKMPKGFWSDTKDGIGVVVGDFRYEQSTRLYDSGKGAKFVAFGIGVFNESGSRIHVNPNNVTLVDLEGSTYSYNPATFDYWSQPLEAVDVLSGNKASGGLVFLIREDTAPAQIIYDIGGLFGDTIVIDLRRPPDETK